MQVRPGGAHPAARGLLRGVLRGAPGPEHAAPELEAPAGPLRLHEGGGQRPDFFPARVLEGDLQLVLLFFSGGGKFFLFSDSFFFFVPRACAGY